MNERRDPSLVGRCDDSNSWSKPRSVAATVFTRTVAPSFQPSGAAVRRLGRALDGVHVAGLGDAAMLFEGGVCHLGQRQQYAGVHEAGGGERVGARRISNAIRRSRPCAHGLGEVVAQWMLPRRAVYYLRTRSCTRDPSERRGDHRTRNAGGYFHSNASDGVTRRRVLGDAGRLAGAAALGGALQPLLTTTASAAFLPDPNVVAVDHRRQGERWASPMVLRILPWCSLRVC